MELHLKRTYHPTGTNGDLMYNSSLVCHSIELPWRHNQSNRSCIPEGRYQLKRFRSPRHGTTVEVCNVPARNAILLHRSNNANRELKGCIAPVMQLDLNQAGVGWMSGKALNRVLELIWAAMENDEEVFLNISKK